MLILYMSNTNNMHDNRYKYVQAPFNTSFSPFISDLARNIHIYEHHCVYEDKLSQMIDINNFTLEEVMEKFKSNKSIINMANQIWNHNFFWKSISLSSDNTQAKNYIVSKISIDDLLIANNQLFGSGWLWIVIDKDTLQMEIKTTSNAELPDNCYMILCLDLWEHAFYIDHQSNRKQFLSNWFKYLVNWDFAYYNLQVHSIL